jgi:hypothetical protein
MSSEIRTWFAVDGCRRRMRSGVDPAEAAKRLAHMLDVPAKDVLQLATAAEAGCAEARAHYGRVSLTQEPPNAP